MGVQIGDLINFRYRLHTLMLLSCTVSAQECSTCNKTKNSRISDCLQSLLMLFIIPIVLFVVHMPVLTSAKKERCPQSLSQYSGVH